jgi:hypothetical protein
MDWIDLAQDRDQRRVSRCENGSFSRRAQLYEVSYSNNVYLT